jgi:hypothetical protein
MLRLWLSTALAGTREFFKLLQHSTGFKASRCYIKALEKKLKVVLNHPEFMHGSSEQESTTILDVQTLGVSTASRILDVGTSIEKHVLELRDAGFSDA